MVYPYVTFWDVLLESYALNLAEKGHNLTIVTSDRDSCEPKIIKHPRISIRHLDSISVSVPGLIVSFPYLLSLEQTLRELQPDIIHINNLPFPSTLQATLIAKKLKIPSIVHVHGVISNINWFLNTAQYFFIYTMGRRIFNDATFIICLTRSDAKEIQRCGCPPEKIRIIPNGVDVEKFKPYGDVIDNSLFWGGRFVQQKGLEYLLNALYLVAKREPEIKLVMTGDGPLFSKTRNVVRQLGLERSVIFKGRVPRDELPRLIGASSVYLLPSLKEGMPFALLEAMACGKSIVGSDIPGINDLIAHGKSGILVPPRKPEVLANAIVDLLSNEDFRRNLGQNARRLVVEKYSWTKIVEKVEEVYFEAAEGINKA